MQGSSGAITMLFTDIEGSTGLWEKEGERMAAALAKHDALLRAAVEVKNGFIWKWTGDGIYAAFDDPLDALEATLAFQRSLDDPVATNGIPIRVRCGLHSGTVERREKDYFGTPVNRAGQIMSAAHGGQVVLSRAVVDALGERLPAGVSLRDLGRVRLKDLTTPEHLYQVVHPDFRQEFPPLRSLEATPNNLPQQTTSFVGREREVAQSKERLGQTRLLTLLGMGGLGKTRLAMQVGADLMTAHPDGVWFVDLAPIVDPALVPSTTAQVLGVREEPGRTLTETLCAHLKPQKLILILDNCEHVVGACGQMVDALLRETPEVRVIATSREALRVQGEQTYPVYPLALPDRNASLETLARSEAVQLFMERARLQKPGFSLTERDAPAVAEICTRLEGIPLAMELAAARMRSLSVQDINTRLKDRFKLLTGGSRVALERQQTLRALVAWSYDLLQETEQRLLERLGVFAGGFEIEAAKEVCGTEPLVPDNLPELLSSLVDKSLVMADDREGGSRYRMLETLRDYARDRLIQREELPATAIRHCNHYLRHGEGRQSGTAGAGAGRVDPAPRSRARQPSRGDSAGARRRDGPDTRGQDRGCADGFLAALRILDRGTPVRERRARSAGSAGIGLRPRACFVYRRRAGGQPERICRGATDAGGLPRLRRGIGEPLRHCDNAVHAFPRPPERGRCGRCARERGGGPADLPRDRRPDRRGDRPVSPRRDLRVLVR